MQNVNVDYYSSTSATYCKHSIPSAYRLGRESTAAVGRGARVSIAAWHFTVPFHWDRQRGIRVALQRRRTGADAEARPCSHGTQSRRSVNRRDRQHIIKLRGALVRVPMSSRFRTPRSSTHMYLTPNFKAGWPCKEAGCLKSHKICYSLSITAICSF